MPPSIRLKAHAKLNLHLEVLGRRTDGYHDLWSIFHLVTLHDQLVFEPWDAGRIVLTCNNEHLPVNDKNLVVRAAKLLQGLGRGAGGCNPGAKITLTKNIPIGAGLGGGSSDAAAALAGLCELWGMAPGRAELNRLALLLGSDVPFFLQGGTALVTGRGENIRPLDWDRTFHFLIAYPGFGVSTAWAYKNLKISLTKEPEFSKIFSCDPSLGPDPWQLAGTFCNHLESAVIPSHPQIAQIKQKMVQNGALNSLMSGSGSSVFGIFPDEASARQAATKLKTQWPCCFYAGSQRS